MARLTPCKVTIPLDEELGLQPTTSSNTSADEEARLGDLCVKIKKQSYMHKLAGYHYESRYFLVGFLPSISLTLACAIIAFFTETQSRLIGLLATLAVFSQALTKHLNQKNNQSKVHHYAANAMHKISEDVTRLQVSIQPLCNDSVGIDRSLLFLERKKSIQDRFEQARDGIDSNIPVEITAAFGLLESKLVHIQSADQTNQEYARFQIGYELLFNVFCNTWMWQLKLPSSRWAVRQVLREMKSMGHIEDDTLLNPVIKVTPTLREDEATMLAHFDQIEKNNSNSSIIQTGNTHLSGPRSNSGLSVIEENTNSLPIRGNRQPSKSSDSDAGLSVLLSDLLRDETSTMKNELPENLPVIHPSRKFSHDPGSEEVVSTPVSISKKGNVSNKMYDDPVVTAIVTAVQTVTSVKSNNYDTDGDDDDAILDEILASNNEKSASISESISVESAKSTGEDESPLVKRLTEIINASKNWAHVTGVESITGRKTPPRPGLSPKKANFSENDGSLASFNRKDNPSTPEPSPNAHQGPNPKGEQNSSQSNIFRRTTPTRPPRAPAPTTLRKKASEDEWRDLQDSNLPNNPEKRLPSPSAKNIFDGEGKIASATTPTSVFLPDHESCSMSEISVSRSLDKSLDFPNAPLESDGNKDVDSQSSKIYSRSLEAKLDSLVDYPEEETSVLRKLSAIIDTPTEKDMVFTRQGSNSSGCVSSAASFRKSDDEPSFIDEEISKDRTTPKVLHKVQQLGNDDIQLQTTATENPGNKTLTAPLKEDIPLTADPRPSQVQSKNSPHSSINGHIDVKSRTSFVSSLECPSSYDALDEEKASKLVTNLSSFPSTNNNKSDASSLSSAVGVLSPIVARARNIVLANLGLRRQINPEGEKYNELNSISPESEQSI
mmetsp:Transcript_13371/g.20357  ORF Transcript_13371/g.20357 Transcript_13371/m.20357 type:complete len:891 (-) Transcript_13371:60-2732(-)